MAVLGTMMVGYGVIAVTAAMLNAKLAWWKQTRPEFVVRAVAILLMGIVFLLLSLLEYGESVYRKNGLSL